MTEKQKQLRDALKANGISLNWDHWRDSQGFGQEIKSKAGIK